VAFSSRKSHIKWEPEKYEWMESARVSLVQVDIAHAQLAQVTWIVPGMDNSGHPGSGSTSGPGWVASIGNAIGESKSWNSTAIFVPRMIGAADMITSCPRGG
jgi:phospholipase C